MGALCRTDFFGWTREQAALLRDVEAGRIVEPGELDWLGLTEEIEGLGRSLQWDLYARYKLLLVQLLRARYQPGFNFPQTCPFTLDHVEDEDFWPDAEGGP